LDGYDKIFPNLIYGEIINKITCLTCKTIKENIEKYMDISLTIDKDVK